MRKKEDVEVVGKKRFMHRCIILIPGKVLGTHLMRARKV